MQKNANLRDVLKETGQKVIPRNDFSGFLFFWSVEAQFFCQIQFAIQAVFCRPTEDIEWEKI